MLSKAIIIFWGLVILINLDNDIKKPCIAQIGSPLIVVSPDLFNP
jgi:hypothetical protein